MNYTADFKCEECGAILRELRDAMQLDELELRRRLHQTADSSRRGIEEMRDVWLASIVKMPTDEMHTILRAQYPRVADMQRKQAEHESRTGHSVFRDGWRTMKMPYEELPRVIRVLSAIR